jgi:hypothetical protein
MFEWASDIKRNGYLLIKRNGYLLITDGQLHTGYWEAIDVVCQQVLLAGEDDHQLCTPK